MRISDKTRRFLEISANVLQASSAPSQSVIQAKNGLQNLYSSVRFRSPPPINSPNQQIQAGPRDLLAGKLVTTSQRLDVFDVRRLKQWVPSQAIVAVEDHTHRSAV